MNIHDDSLNSIFLELIGQNGKWDWGLKQKNTEERITYSYYTGWCFFRHPSEKYASESQLGWWNSQYDGKVIKLMFQTTNTEVLYILYMINPTCFKPPTQFIDIYWWLKPLEGMVDVGDDLTYSLGRREEWGWDCATENYYTWYGYNIPLYDLL